MFRREDSVRGGACTVPHGLQPAAQVPGVRPQVIFLIRHELRAHPGGQDRKLTALLRGAARAPPPGAAEVSRFRREARDRLRSRVWTLAVSFAFAVLSEILGVRNLFVQIFEDVQCHAPGTATALLHEAGILGLLGTEGGDSLLRSFQVAVVPLIPSDPHGFVGRRTSGALPRHRAHAAAALRFLHRLLQLLVDFPPHKRQGVESPLLLLKRAALAQISFLTIKSSRRIQIFLQMELHLFDLLS
mmetsp:Transcript_48684/g.99000  ORF Transcript_48684/g.99000 Transcript_48684/m.99000 type:complete len:244 (+) Transcript_48684:931-1662(+)